MSKYIVSFAYYQQDSIGPFEKECDAWTFGREQDNGSPMTNFMVKKLLSPNEFLKERKKACDHQWNIVRDEPPPHWDERCTLCGETRKMNPEDAFAD